MIRPMLVFAAALLPWGMAAANDFPTIERVEYVLGCVRDAQGPPTENVYKCACVIDAIAAQISYDEYVQLSTATNAFSIGGERGEVMRAYTGGREMTGRYRKIQGEARKSCLVR